MGRVWDVRTQESLQVHLMKQVISLEQIWRQSKFNMRVWKTHSLSVNPYKEQQGMLL